MIRSTAYDEFYNSLPANVQNKVKYAMNILAEVKVVNTKLVKKLVDTDFYELRISVGNEYRVILFTIDHENFIEAEQILLLNGFMKKSVKDYKKEIQKAEQILNSLRQRDQRLTLASSNIFLPQRICLLMSTEQRVLFREMSLMRSLVPGTMLRY